MDLESTSGQQATFIKENINLTRDTAMEKCNGMMEVNIWVTGKMEFRMDLGR
jgi:hypothetical protein